MIRPPYPFRELIGWPLRCLFPSRRGLEDIPTAPIAADLGSVSSPKQRLVVLGDIMPLRGGRLPRVDDTVASVIRSADLVIGNLEGPVSSRRASGANRTLLRHSMDAAWLEALLDEMGATRSRTVLSIANNHIGDDGLEGVEATARALADLGVAACGRRREGRVPVDEFEAGSLSVGVVAWTEWLNHAPFPAGAGVWRLEDLGDVDWQAAAARLDLLVAFPHWDLEFRHAPSARTRALAGRLAREGFDLVIGHHPHVIQPVEWVEDTLVMYSIGCFHGPLPWLSTWRHRLSWMAEVRVTTPPGGRARTVGYRLYPLVLMRESSGHALVPLDCAPDDDRRRMQRVIDTVFGSPVAR